MKKYLYMSLVIMMLAGLFLVACGESSTSTTSVPPSTTAKSTAPPPSTSTPAKTTSSAPATTSTMPARPGVYGGTFTWNHNGGITQLGAIADDLGIAGNRNTYPMFEGLLKTDEQENIKPWLATSWDISEDGKTITLKLREGIKFTDGTDFDAAAVQFNLEADYKANLSGSAFMSNIESYDVPDKYTLKINLKKFDSTFLLRLAQSPPPIGLIASPTAMQKPTTPETLAMVHSVGTGPFILDSWERDSYIKYKKNPNYWQPGLPYLDAIQINNTADVTVSIMSLRAGEVQAVENVDPVDAHQLADLGFTIYQPNLFYVHSLLPDGNNPNSPFAKKEVRLALDYAIDKRTMAQGIGMGYYEALGQLATTKDPWYNPDLEYREYNPQKAKDLLAQAGYPNGFTTTLLTDVMARHDTLVAVQTYLEAVGIKTNLEVMDFGAAFTRPRQGWEGLYFPGFPNVDTLLGLWGRFGDKTNYISIYQPPGWWEKWDELIAERDTTKRLQDMKDILKMMHDEAINIPYQGDAPLVAMVPYLHGFEHHANHIVSFWDPGNIWLSPH
jgi:peptide/nickel transport system substrate-binding protein